MNFKGQFGPVTEDNQTRFRLWAPQGGPTALCIDGRAAIPMDRLADGWHEARITACPGALYRFRVNDRTVPDPASRALFGGVHGQSIVPASHYKWKCEDWPGRIWEETVLYEMHVGLCGGFQGTAARFDDLAALGITAIELMPIAEFPGTRNWGYDGAYPFAPAAAYGTPDELKALVDHAHECGLMVFLDVVYNHFGPDGNYLANYAPEFFLPEVHTPWGAAINFANPQVRRFFTENALYWLLEFRFDGLRFDAVHTIPNAEWLDALAADLRTEIPSNRHIHLVLENEKNDASHLRRGFDAQWNDDIHHALHVLLTGETTGYYADYAPEPAALLARALSEGFIYQGQPSRVANGKNRGTPSNDLPATAFVSFLQNHDQTGNRALGERLTTLVEPRALKAAIALVLLAPQIPLIFMGEEIGSRAPFLYFTDHTPELADLVRRGRQKEFAAFVPDAANLPDPNAPETFNACKPQSDAPQAATWRALYRALLTIRREQIVPHLHGVRSAGAEAVGSAAVLARWQLSNGAMLVIASNFGDDPVPTTLPREKPVWDEWRIGAIPPRTTLAWILAA